MKSAEIIQGMVDRGSLDTVADALGDARPARGAKPFVPATLEGTPPLPAPGIYFGMDDATYHALPALSNSGIKKLSASPMLFWAGTPWLSEKKRKQVEESADDKAHQIFGRAYHCRLMEGASAYALRYAVELTPEDCEGCLESTAQIKAAIGRFEVEAFDKKTGDSKGMVPVKPVSKVPDTMPDGSPYERAAVKSDWIAQLLTLDPDAQVFAAMQSQHARDHAGKTFLTADQHMELEIAAAMVERDPECKTAFVGGHAEVVLIWYCPATGVPMKAKVDYLKIGEMVDLKSIANQRELSIENCIRFAIGSYKYNLQPVVYFEGAEEVRRLIREARASAPVFTYLPDGTLGAGVHVENHNWAVKWAQHKSADEWLWIFQQKGEAPITRGVRFPRGDSLESETRFIVERAEKLFLRFSEVFGTAPWIDSAEIYTIAYEDVPRAATEI